MILFLGYVLAIILSGYIGCRFSPYRDDAMVREAKRCQAELKEVNLKADRLSADYAEALLEISRLNNKLAAKSTQMEKS